MPCRGLCAARRLLVGEDRKAYAWEQEVSCQLAPTVDDLRQEGFVSDSKQDYNRRRQLGSTQGVKRPPAGA